MNKVIITMISIIVIISAVLVGMIIFKPANTGEKEVKEAQIALIAEEEILDDCTDEYEQMEFESTVKANTEAEKTSPNCSITKKTYYKKCGHVKNEYSNIPNNFVNLERDEIQEQYPEYEIESFASNEIILYQEEEGECKEHYMVKEKDGIIAIYQIQEDGSQIEIEETGIVTEYLPEEDKVEIKKGIQINGRQELNKFIENFE